MCGIVGYIGVDHRDASTRMNALQIHRGPDDSGSYHDDAAQLSLAMRRLSIVDIADGHQPMGDASGNLVIVFNGEIFNAPQLRGELEKQGCVFRTSHSDTEVILQLYDRLGGRCVERLNGMFSFAIFDRGRGQLFLARDQFGIKPLFYWQDARGFAFASEIKSLLGLPRVSRDIDHGSVSFYLSLQFTPPDQSIYTAIHKLPAAHTLTFDLAKSKTDTQRYWFPPSVAAARPTPRRHEIIHDLRERLEVAAAAWTMSDVEIGVSLSGGIDSAAIVGLLASRGHRLKTWTLGFDDAHSGTDERRLARSVASRWGTEHSEVTIRSETLLGDLDAMVAQLDEPYGGGLPSWYVFREMSREVKVALTGTGGDELFGNYGKWQRMQFPSIGWATRRIRSLQVHGLAQCIANRHGSLFKVQFGELEKREILQLPSVIGSTPDRLEQSWERCGGTDPRTAVACVDMQSQLPEEFLMMTDRFSMAWSLEARTPFLDRSLAEYVMSLPPAIRSPASNGKGLLISAVRDLLPEPIGIGLKRGFVLPTSAWLRGQLRPLIDHYLGADYLRRQGIFRDDLHARLVRPHQAGDDGKSEKLWTLLMFQLWWQGNSGLRP
jgi:asparagine synthase (glutamine-hydrolysing)